MLCPSHIKDWRPFYVAMSQLTDDLVAYHLASEEQPGPFLSLPSPQALLIPLPTIAVISAKKQVGTLHAGDIPCFTVHQLCSRLFFHHSIQMK